MVDTPAHIDVIPKPFTYEAVPTAISDKIQQLFHDDHITHLKRAIQANKAPNDPSGYYQAILSGSDKKLFLRIAQNKRAWRLIRADIIARQAQQEIQSHQNIECSCLIKPFCTAFDQDHMLLAYPWNEGVFIDNIDTKKMSKMGKNLNRLHHALNKNTKWSKNIELRTIKRLKHWQVIYNQLLNNIESKPDETAEKLCPNRKNDIVRLLEEDIPFPKIENLFTQNAIKTHGDLHRGNILFSESAGITTFLDFEDAEASFFNPLYDLAWLVERFCLTETRHAQELAESCLEGYLQSNDTHNALNDIKTIIIGRNIIWLSVLYDSPIANAQTQYQEAEKFLKLIKATQGLICH